MHPKHNQISKFNQDSGEQNLDHIVNELRYVIDQLSDSFAKAKSLILDLARTIDERNQCEQSEICRKIKDVLKDKIAQGKITAKWVEECLPQEYKRKYTKCEQSSLLEDSNQSAAEISLDNKGEAVTDSPTKPRAEDQGTTRKTSTDENNFLNFEFALQANDISEQLFFSSEKYIWFHGKIDRNTAQVIAASIGRIS